MMNKLNKWDLVDIQMAETSKLELAQEYADREIENLKAFARRKRSNTNHSQGKG